MLFNWFWPAPILLDFAFTPSKQLSRESELLVRMLELLFNGAILIC